jgi:hypothetical protein
MCSRTAAPMIAQGPRKGEPSSTSMRYGFRPQPARLVRGSSRRIMSMRFRPANIRVINRRASSSLSSALLSEQQTLKAHQQELCSRRAARLVALMPESVFAGKGSLRRAKHRRALASSARFRRKADCDGRLRREQMTIELSQPIGKPVFAPDGAETGDFRS